MTVLAKWFWLVALVALVSCATPSTAPTAPSPTPRGKVQDILLQTEPPGAACAVLQENAVVASVAATPGIAMVPRKHAPIEIVCGKEGYLEERVTFPVQSARQIELEGGLNPKLSGGQIAAMVGGGAAMVVGQIIMMVPSPLALAGAGVQLLGNAVATADERENVPLAYEPVPVCVLIPAVFESESARDAFFGSLRAKIEASGAERRARVDNGCFYWPCKPEDGPCGDLFCEKRREQVKAETTARLERIPGQRAQTKLVAP
jgi:hypothetical protein